MKRLPYKTRVTQVKLCAFVGNSGAVPWQRLKLLSRHRVGWGAHSGEMHLDHLLVKRADCLGFRLSGASILFLFGTL